MPEKMQNLTAMNQHDHVSIHIFKIMYNTYLYLNE